MVSCGLSNALLYREERKLWCGTFLPESLKTVKYLIFFILKVCLALWPHLTGLNSFFDWCAAAIFRCFYFLQVNIKEANAQVSLWYKHIEIWSSFCMASESNWMETIFSSPFISTTIYGNKNIQKVKEKGWLPIPPPPPKKKKKVEDQIYKKMFQIV